jgi:HK97 family phage major capsid protein
MSADINAVIEKIGKSYEASKKAQDEIDVKLEKGLGGIAEIKAKQEKIDADLNAALEAKKSIEQLEATVARMAASVEEKSDSKVDNSAYASGMKKWLKARCPEHLGNLKLDEKELKALQSNIDPQGGYSVMPFIGGTEKLIFETSPVRSLASVVTIGTDEYKGFYDDDEFDSGWVGEISTRTETGTADIGMFSIPVREVYSRFKISDRLLEDSMWNMESWAQMSVADKLARTEATAFISGSGSLQPQGLATGTVNTANPADYLRGSVGTKVTAGATAITTDELVDLRTNLKAAYRANAYYAFNRATEGYIRKLKDGQGNYIWQPSYQMGVADSLLGQRVVIMEDMADIATGAISVVLADFRSTYLIVDRVGLSVLRDPYSSASTGQTLFHVRKRVGGGIKNWDSIKYLKQL